MQKVIPFGRLRKTTLYEEAMLQIKKAILGGEYRPGEYLPPERSLAEALGVGRPTIREALKILTDRGLIELDRTTRQYVVKTPNLENCVLPIREQISWLVQVSEKTIGEFWDVIPHVMGLTAIAILDTATEDDLQRLEGVLSGMDQGSRDFSSCCRVFYQFGLDMAEIAKNPLIMLLWKMFDGVIQDEIPPVLSVMEPKGPANLIDFHLRVLGGVRNRSIDGIHRAVADRLAYLKDRQLRLCD